MRMKQKLFSMLALLLMAATGAWAQTTVNGIFTVNADGDQVQFASGNLRYTSGAWSFFDHQYDYYAEYSAASWDKFGWSTSGTTYGMSTSTNESLYKGAFVDWGNAVGTGWRTLSNDEWAYVVNTRSGSTIGTTANARFAKAKVNDVQGLILFPDTYTHPDGVTAPTGVNATGNTGWNGNNYTAADWTKMESAGCVFLPAAGGRYNYSNPTLVVNAGNEGNYWSSTSDNSTANLLTFNGSTFKPSITDSPRMGYSVRLVKSAPTYSITLAEGTEDEGNWNVPTKAAEGATVTATYSGEKKVKSVKAVKKEVGPEVTTFSELQAVLSAGKDVKLMNDIVCTAEIEITSGALTIDGNGKTLSTTSAIRAFKVGSSATVAFKNLTLTGFVNGGGPAINNDGTIVLDGCTISNCHVNNSNGGGAIESTGKLYAVNTIFSGNYSGEIGGAINNYWGSLYMTDCTFTDNYTTDSHAYYGGAIGINGGDEVRLINCSFSENKYGTTAGTNDIGVYNKPTNYTIAGCTGATIAARADVGEITPIASGTATLDYSDLSNISFTYSAPAPASATDLATITADYEAKDGETLTGELGSNVKISIADGATVTLKDVNINGVNNYSYAWAGITCAGDATITLEGTNTVKGFAEKYPGIFVSSGKTLIINGTGELNASSNGSADNGSGGAGIGGGYQMNCGNIEIQSGTVTATGNQWGAGIGGGYNASCGNITISGGTVTATGGEYGAGIGGGKRGTANVSCGNITISGGTVNATGGADAAGIGGGKGNNNSYKSSCGTITITTGVTSVTATKGNSNAQSIGAGKYGTCGSVTIEDSSKVTQK